MLNRPIARRAFTLVLMFMVSSTPIFTAKSSPNERIILKQPIFGSLMFATDLTFDSMMGGKYQTIDHPYIYINTGTSVKCLELESGRLAHTIPFDPAAEEPYGATNKGIKFFKTDENRAMFFLIKRYDGTQSMLPRAANANLVCWEPRPVIWLYDNDSKTLKKTITAIDENGNMLWKLEDDHIVQSDSSGRYWIRTNDADYLVDPFTGKALAILPDGYGYVRATGSLVYTLHESKDGISGIFNIETGKLVHECKDCFHTIGKGSFLCYKIVDRYSIHNKCYNFNRYSSDGELIESFQLDMPNEFEDCCHFVINFGEKHLIIAMTESNIVRIILLNTKTNTVDIKLDLINSCRILDDGKLFYLGDRKIGCIDTNDFQQIWSMPIGNSYLLDIVYEKDFGDFKLVSRDVYGSKGGKGYIRQVKIVDKADGFVEPYEFEFEHGGLRNCYETDYGFININDLSSFSIYIPQVSFYRRGTVNAVETIDYIGEIVEDTISIEDGRYLVSKLKDGRAIRIDAREMNVIHK